MMHAASRIFAAVRIQCGRFGRDERGAAVAFLVVIPVLAGAVAIGVETGQLYRMKRQMQSAADAAALAGSIDRMAGKDNATITTDARFEAQRNGFTNGVDSVVVTVNAPPTSGSYVATPAAVEVIITKTQSFSFGAVLNNWMGRSSSGFTTRARSVAARQSTTSTTTSTTTNYEGGGCMVALTPNAEQGVSFTSFNSYASDCTIMSNGSATGTGSNASITMSSFNSASLRSVWTRGSFSASGYSSLTPPAAAALTSQTSYAVDPYAGLGNPTPGTCSFTNYRPSSGTTITLSPGTYCGGLQVSSFNTVYFQAGIYYIANGDLYLTSVNSVSCSNCTGDAGITFVLTQTTGNMADIGGVRITSENTVTLNAPKTGTYKGILFYQDRRVANGTMASTSKIFTVSSLNNASLWGAIYFPNNRIDISSLNSTGSSANGCTIWIGRYIKFTSYNSAYVAGCKDASGNFIATPAGIQTTTTTTTTTNKGKVFE